MKRETYIKRNTKVCIVLVCEAFKIDSDLEDGKCPDHKN